MEAIFDEISAALKSPPRLRARSGALALRLAESLATGLAIGIGIAVVHVLAG